MDTLIRYEELYAINSSQVRATPKEHHNDIVNHLVGNLQELEKDNLFGKWSKTEDQLLKLQQKQLEDLINQKS